MKREEEKKLIISCIVLFILAVVLGGVFYLVWREAVEMTEKKSVNGELRVRLGDTLFVFNETGVVYNNSFYHYDDVFVKYSMAVREAEIYRDLCDRMSRHIEELIVLYDMPVVWD